MDLKEYILSGIVEDYCLGLLSTEENNAILQQAQMHPEIQKAIDDFMESLGQYSLDTIIHPPAQLKENVLDILNNLGLEEEKNIRQLPLLNKYSDHKNWLH